MFKSIAPRRRAFELGRPSVGHAETSLRLRSGSRLGVVLDDGGSGCRVPIFDLERHALVWDKVPRPGKEMCLSPPCPGQAVPVTGCPLLDRDRFEFPSAAPP